MRIAGIIVAAGSGRRFGFKKQFAQLNGRMVLEYSVSVFRDVCDDTVIVVQKEDMDFVKNRFEFAKVVEGGAERMNSVYNGLVSVSCDVVLIHDAARPLLGRELVDRVLNKAVEFESCVPVLKIAETIKRIKNGKIVGSVDRNELYLAQTPQAFNYKKLKIAYDRAVTKEKNYTDEASIWEEFYGSAEYVEGDKKNIKITTKEDLEFAECLLG